MSANHRWQPWFAAGLRLAMRPWRALTLAPATVLRAPRHMPDGMPVILVANHGSFWDGFVLADIAHAWRPGAPLAPLMLQRELEQRRWLERVGCMGITPGRPASFATALRALADARTRDSSLMPLLFPQGRMWPATRRPLGFHRGVEAVAEALAPCAVVPVALTYAHLQRPQATPFVFANGWRVVRGSARGLAAALERDVGAGLDATRVWLDRAGEAALQTPAGAPAFAGAAS